MNSRISPLIAFMLLFFSLCFQSTNNTVTDTILPGQSLTHPETIVSRNGIFELCFFSPGHSTKNYLAIRFKNVSEQSVVWVANREYPFPDSTAVLSFNQVGDLVISDGKMTYAVTSTSAGNGTYAMLLDTGNLILTNRVFELFWLSFDRPTDTLLPGMTLGYSWPLTSWKSLEDPAPGNFSLRLGDPRLGDRLTIMEGPDVYWTAKKFILISAIPFVVELKSRHRKRPGDPNRIGKCDLTRTGIVDVDVGNGDPDEELFGLDPSELPHAALLNKGRDIVIIRDVSADRVESVLLLALLLEPHEPGGAVVVDLVAGLRASSCGAPRQRP
ncbi:hypothetical protein SO802_029786 [Lithocarpus litseifolius]|uniref:Bulb-type lectin domain-containing protein n=1 Tax=Lithocarpus litseifolius TaxID=425828 RepID=A0AAW2BUM6_9ROSI